MKGKKEKSKDSKNRATKATSRGSNENSYSSEPSLLVAKKSKKKKPIVKKYLSHLETLKEAIDEEDSEEEYTYDEVSRNTLNFGLQVNERESTIDNPSITIQGESMYTNSRYSYNRSNSTDFRESLDRKHGTQFRMSRSDLKSSLAVSTNRNSSTLIKPINASFTEKSEYSPKEESPERETTKDKPEVFEHFKRIKHNTQKDKAYKMEKNSESSSEGRKTFTK